LSTYIFLSPLDVGLRCVMQLCKPLFISQSRKGKAIVKCNRDVKLVWITIVQHCP
jgi:hypothetical protein